MELRYKLRRIIWGYTAKYYVHHNFAFNLIELDSNENIDNEMSIKSKHF